MMMPDHAPISGCRLGVRMGVWKRIGEGGVGGSKMLGCKLDECQCKVWVLLHSKCVDVKRGK